MDIFRTGGRGEAQPNFTAFGGVFSHYKGDSKTTELTTKGQILAQNDLDRARYSAEKTHHVLYTGGDMRVTLGVIWR